MPKPVNHNQLMKAGVKGGHMGIVELMLDLGAKGYNKTMTNAVQEGYKNIDQMMLDYGVMNYIRHTMTPTNIL